MDLGSGEIDLDDATLHDAVVKLESGEVSVLSPGHGDESKTLGSLVVVDDLGVLDVAELSKQHDEIVLPVPEGDVGHVESLGLMIVEAAWREL